MQMIFRDVVWFLFWSSICSAYMRTDPTNNSHFNKDDNRSRRLEIQLPPPTKEGAHNIVPGVSVYGAYMSGGHNHFKHGTAEYNRSHADMVQRQENMQQLKDSLPFPLREWPSVFTKPCPNSQHNHKTERGVALAHYQIWADFTYFDRDVMEATKRTPPEYLESTPYSSSGGHYAAFPNGTFYKDGVVYSENDIMVIFEDDVVSAILDLNGTMIEELSVMNTDLLFLGWCEGRAAKPVPLCAHAYAITRKGAAKLMHYYQPCGKAVDEQFVMMAKNGFITWRRVNGYSYKNIDPNYRDSGDKTFGIFRQNKRIGSMNGHRV